LEAIFFCKYLQKIVNVNVVNQYPALLSIVSKRVGSTRCTDSLILISECISWSSNTR